MSVAGSQSVYNKACDFGAFNIIIVDEAHLIASDGDGMYRTFLKNAKVVNPQSPATVTAETAIEPANSEFDLDSWSRQYCPELGAPQVWKDGRKWVFPVCPFNDAHCNRSAVLIQQSNGAIAFRCHHNSCTGNDWHKLRELREPGCCDRKEKVFEPVDISGILNQKPRNAAPLVETTEEPP